MAFYILCTNYNELIIAQEKPIIPYTYPHKTPPRHEPEDTEKITSSFAPENNVIDSCMYLINLQNSIALFIKQQKAIELKLSEIERRLERLEKNK